MAAEQQAPFNRRMAKLANLKEKVDQPDEFFMAMVQRTVNFEQKIEKLNDKEASDLVISLCSTRESKADIGQALICLLLTEKENSAKYLNLLSQMGDSWFQALYTLNMVSIEMFPKLNESCKDMLIVYFREGVKLNVQKLDSNFINFLRTLNGTGDWNSRLRLSRDFAALFLECSEYMIGTIKNGSMFFGVTIMTFSHIIADIAQHRDFERDKDMMVDVIVKIVRGRPHEAFQLGRELFYCLMRISKISQISQLFNDLIKKPSSFGIKSVEDVLFKAPNPYLCTNRLSIEVTRKVEFLITGLPPSRPNYQTKHIEWFTNSYLKGPDAITMRSEIIRFIQYYYPPNQPQNFFEARMQLINYLLSTAAYGPEAQWCKTALWIDWIFFDPQSPPAMFYVLEPALAVVRFYLQVQVQKATSILEYLVKEVKEIFPPGIARITQAVNQAMSQMSTLFMESKQPPISNILENARIDAAVRAELRTLFKDFVTPTPAEPNNKEINSLEKVKRESKREPEIDERRSLSPPLQKRMRLTVSKEERNKELEACMTILRDDVREYVLLVKTAVDSDESVDSDKGEAVLKLVLKSLEDEDSIEEEQHWAIGHCLKLLIDRPVVTKTLVPEATRSEHHDPSQEIFSHPFFIVFRQLGLTPINDTTSRTPLVRIISAMREKDNFTTVLLLYFIKCEREIRSSVSEKDLLKCYEEVANESEKEVSELLAEDLETAAFDDDLKLFNLLLPMAVEKFYQDIGSNPEVLHVICSNMDSSQLVKIVGCGIREGTTLFRKDNVCNIVTASMEWSTTAQLMLWQLIHAEAVPMDWLLPIVPKIRSEQHVEASTNLILTLRRLDREPGMNLLRTILSRPPSKEDFFTINCFRILIDDSDMCTKVADLMAQLIKKLINNNEIHMGNTPTSQRTQGKKAAPKLCLEQLLHHMQYFCGNCLGKEQKVAETFLSKWVVQEAFKTITSNDKTTMMKPKFQQLFAVLELLGDSDSPQSSRTLRGNRGNNQPKNTKKRDDDEDGPPSGKHKKRQVVTLDSDSD